MNKEPITKISDLRKKEYSIIDTHKIMSEELAKMELGWEKRVTERLNKILKVGTKLVHLNYGVNIWIITKENPVDKFSSHWRDVLYNSKCFTMKGIEDPDLGDLSDIPDRFLKTLHSYDLMEGNLVKNDGDWFILAEEKPIECWTFFPQCTMCTKMNCTYEGKSTDPNKLIWD